MKKAKKMNPDLNVGIITVEEIAEPEAESCLLVDEQVDSKAGHECANRSASDSLTKRVSVHNWSKLARTHDGGSLLDKQE